MTGAFLGIDVGTTSTKAVVFDAEGRELARAASQPYRNSTPAPGWVEQDPEEIWEALLGVIREAVQGIRVASVCMAVQSGSLVMLDSNGRPVYPLVTWLDGRAEEIVRVWREQNHQDWVKPLSGWSLYPSLCLPTIAWFRQNNPQVFAAAEKFLSLNDFLAFRLTGDFVTNPSNAGGMQLVDIRSGQWSDDLCDLAGIRTENLSRIQPSGAPIGAILPEVCNQTGLTPGALLVNGGHDQGCTALGLGIIEPGKILLACGTAWVFTGVLHQPEMETLPPSLDLNFHAAPERWTLSQSLGGLGASFEWWMNTAYRAESRAATFAALDTELPQTGPDGELFFLPLTGGHDNPATTRRGGFIGLQLSHSRADMARAVMESAAFELRWALEPVLAAGLPIERLWMVGGAARSPLWPSILADVTGLPIRLPEYDNWSALGAALLAGHGLGAFASLEEGLAQFQKPHCEVQPQADMQETCRRAFEKYWHYCALLR